MGIFSKREKIDWVQLTNSEQLDQVVDDSAKKPVLLFKHSTRCAISTMALDRYKRGFNSDVVMENYFLDLLSFRDISNAIAQRFGVTHQSPQVILLSKGEVVYHTSHQDISFDKIEKAISQLDAE